MTQAGVWSFEEARGDNAVLTPELASRVRSFRLIAFLAQQMRSRMDARLRADGLTTQQAAVITIVDGLNAPTLGDVALALGVSHQSVRQVADALVRKGFLEIERDPADHRRRRLTTTQQSAAYWASRSPADFEAVAEWFSPLTNAQADELLRLLQQLAAGLSAR